MFFTGAVCTGIGDGAGLHLSSLPVSGPVWKQCRLLELNSVVVDAFSTFLNLHGWGQTAVDIRQVGGSFRLFAILSEVRRVLHLALDEEQVSVRIGIGRGAHNL